MNDIFHRFAELPWELRDQIWNLAVRPAHPGVHTFKLYDQDKDGVMKGTVNVGLGDPWFHVCLRLAAPEYNKSSGTDICNNNNFSTYLIDGGLWTACKESRLIMKHSFRCLYGSQKTLKSTPEQSENHIAATGYFEGQGEKPYYFTVLPHRDLFILQPQNLDTIDWSCINDYIPIGSTHWGFEGLKNIALEYNPEWGRQVSKTTRSDIGDLSIVKMIVEMSEYAWHLDTLWFVDYNLTRTDEEITEDDIISQGYQQDVFCSRDGRLVDAEYGRRSWRYWKHIDEEKAYEDDWDKTSTTFVYNIRQQVADYWEIRDPDDTNRLSIRLLGWDRRQV
ncbi:hypothetical protein FDECE_8345 [Fusarium decemcellulare]|nr:hypothetical protein FDECE_8345 [Fusarium decemcellulare]